MKRLELEEFAEIQKESREADKEVKGADSKKAKAKAKAE